MTKIFVRERRDAGRGTGRPRFVIVAVQGTDLKVFHPRIRRKELEALAEAVNAEIVYLPRGEESGEETEGRGGHGRRRRREPAES